VAIASGRQHPHKAQLFWNRKDRQSLPDVNRTSCDSSFHPAQGGSPADLWKSLDDRAMH